MNNAVVILAGGDGRRIGGDKPLRLLGGHRLIDHAAAQARQWSKQIAVSVRRDDQLGDVGFPILVDDPAIEGPVAGLVAGLRFGREAGAETMLTIPADMPFLPADLMDRLEDSLRSGGAALASSGGHIHPVCGLWTVSALERAPDYLRSGSRSLKNFAELVGFATVDWAVEPSDPFFNINSPDDLAAAERLLRR